MMNRKKQRMIAAIICVALIIAMLAGIVLPYVLPGVE
jgi:type IV secretory pathway component VirB8